MPHRDATTGATLILLKRLLTEPLFHFLALALVIFAGYSILAPTGPEKPDSIVVTAPKIEQLASVFAKTMQRQPSVDELKGLIDDYVKEEIYAREALALGLDKDDTVIRRRLRLKMEFMNDAAVDALTPTDADLEAYLNAHPAAFEADPMIAFKQIFLNPERRGDRIDQDTASVLEDLRMLGSADPATLGDTTLLPYELPLTSKSSISQIFGPEFTVAIFNLDPGRWAGPIKSAFGLHIVHVSERKAGHLPLLSEIRAAVVHEWSDAKRKELEEDRFNDLLKRYRVTIEMPSEAGTNQ